MANFDKRRKELGLDSRSKFDKQRIIRGISTVGDYTDDQIQSVKMSDNFNKRDAYRRENPYPKLNANMPEAKDSSFNPIDVAKDVGGHLKNLYHAVNPFDSVTLDDLRRQKQSGQMEPSSSSDELRRFGTRFQNSANFGLTEMIEKDAGVDTNTFNKRQGAGNVADIAADFAGYVVPGAGIASGLRAVGAGAKIGKGMTAGQRALQYGKEGALTGLGISLAETPSREAINPNQSVGDHLKRIGLETSIGAVADPAIMGIGRGVKKGAQRLIQSPERRQLIQDISTKGIKPKQETLDKLLPQNIIDQNAATKEAVTNIKPLKNNTKNEYINIDAVKEPKLIRVDSKESKRAQAIKDFNSQSIGNDLSFREKVDRAPKKEKKFAELYQRLRTDFIDDLAPLEKLEKKVKGKIPSAENSLYKQARLFRGSPEKANQYVQNKLKPIIKQVEKEKYTYQDLGDYALAVHAKDVNKKGLQSGFTNKEIESVISKYNNSTVMEKARKELVDVSTDLLDRLAKSGVINEDAVKNMRKKWPNYMPLFRSFDDDKVEFGTGLSKALANVSSPIKKLEGSDRKVVDPVESMIKNIFKTTNVADRNTVARQLADISEDSGGLVKKLNAKEQVGRKNVVSVMENGEKVKYEVPPDIYKTMLNLDKESSNFLIKVLQKPASTLRAGATLTPEFSLRNPMRDIAQAYVVSNSKFNPITDFTYGLVQSIGKGRPIKIGKKTFNAPGKLYRQFIEDNAGYGNIVSMDREVHRNALQRVVNEGNTKKFVNVLNPKSWIRVLRSLADVSETATKLGEYRAAIRSGVTRQEAAYRARDIMDFARSGTSIREANKVVAFMNANIQGKSKLIRAIKENPTQVTSKAITAVSLPTIGAFLASKYMANEEQEKIINDAPTWLKDTFWLVPIPGTSQIARIPKPFDLAPIFANSIERTLDYIYKNDKEAFDNFSKETFSAYSIPAMLTGVAPIIEGIANYSFFRQGPIIPQREQDMNYPDQFDINTSETAKFVAKGVNKVTGGEGSLKNFGSPRVIDNTIRGLTGGLGIYASNAVDAILEKTDTIEKPEKPSKQINQQPLLRSFLVNKTSTGSAVGDLYDLRDKLQREKGSAKSNEQPFNDGDNLKYTKRVTGTIGDITKRMRLIENDPTLKANEKRKLLDRLNAQRNELARKAVKRIKEGK